MLRSPSPAKSGRRASCPTTVPEGGSCNASCSDHLSATSTASSDRPGGPGILMLQKLCFLLAVCVISSAPTCDFIGVLQDFAGKDVPGPAFHYVGKSEAEKDASCCEHCNSIPGCQFWVRSTNTTSCWAQAEPTGAAILSATLRRRRPPPQRHVRGYLVFGLGSTHRVPTFQNSQF